MVVCISAQTADGVASVDCCIDHIWDGYAAAATLSENVSIELLDGAVAALARLTCPGCGALMMEKHQHGN